MAEGIGLGLGLLLRTDESRILNSATASHIAPRGPRSLGIRGGFVASPAANLPRTLYTRDPLTNPLIPFATSPNLEIPLVQSNPALHLRTMRKRSIAYRHFGVSGDAGIEPFDGKVSPVLPVSPVAAQDSPTVAASPTITNTPTVLPTPTDVVEQMTHPFYAASIALSVFLGIAILGLVSWFAFVYRRRRRLKEDKSRTEGMAKGVEHEAFSSSNIVEKGMRRSSLSFTNTGGPMSIVSSCGYSDGRRVSFIDARMRPDSFEDGHDGKHFTLRIGDAPQTPRTRQRSSTLSAIERSLASSRPPSAFTISTLDPIEEEHLAAHTTPTLERPNTPTPGAIRPDSMASTTTRSSAYTTASARSSISDLTTLSTISCLSAFPETPRAETRTLPSALDTPTKTSSTHGRKNRARSQTVVNVKSVDMIRIAVGRTMSLQPSKDVAKALQQISAVEEARMLAELCRGREELLFRPPTPEAVQTAPGEHFEAEDADITLVESAVESPRPGDGMGKILFSPESKPLATAMDDETPTSSPVTRSRSFPSKLLSRRQSLGRNEGTRRSEVITEGYLKRALRALRGEDEMPPMPTLSAATVPGRINWRDSADSTSTWATASTSHTLDDVPFSPVWDDQADTPEFDAYYLYQQNGFDLGKASDEEEQVGDEYGSAELPHIRITSH